MSPISRAEIWRTLRKTGWVEEYITSQLHRCSRAEVNKFLLAYVMLFKNVYFRQYLTAAAYYCQVEVKVRDRIAVVISEIIGRSGRHFYALFLW